MSRDDKLKIISDFRDVSRLSMEKLSPNEHGDWISQRNEKFGTWIAIGDKDDKTNKNTFFVPYYSNGLKTQRDTWCYNSSSAKLCSNVKKTIDFYNQQRLALSKGTITEVSYKDESFAWTRATLNDVQKNKDYDFDKGEVRIASYRPYFKQKLFYYRPLNEMMYQIPKLFPTENTKNLLICVHGLGSNKDYSTLISNCIPDLGFESACQCFPLYWYETIEPDQKSLFADNDAQIVRHEAVSDFILERAQSKYGNKVQREDIFYYVYGILHSKSYRETFEADLKKMLPRIPLVSDYQKFWDFSKAGRELANLHLNYEKVAAYPDVQVESRKMVHYEFSKTIYDYDDGTPMAAEAAKKHASSKADEYEYYAVQQMKFPKKGQKDTIIYNHYHTIKNIPEKAYEYVVNGKSAIEWIMERYAVTTDKKSGITNNPNDWALEHEQARYIFDLLLSVINVSVQTVDIVNNLPEVDWDRE